MIAFDSSASGVSVSGNSLTYPHTCTGTNLVLMVNVWISGTSDIITSVAYNGVAMTRIKQVTQSTSGNFLTLYMLVNPATGANNIAITTSAGVNIRSVSASYTGCKQTNQPDASTTGTTNSASSITHSLTTIASSCWIITITQNDTGNATDGTNYTNRSNSGGGAIGDTNAAVGSGATSQTVNVSGSANWAIIQASLAPISVRRSSVLTFFI